jgi:hypothetical protein
MIRVLSVSIALIALSGFGYAQAPEVDPNSWTGSLSGKAALKMKESQCPEPERTTRRV